ncbi:MAG: hypothetical protein K2I69_02985 [Muribaculaceae bacterium]|nr:hypothetical protein [Muribaculaceae bacterium]
MKTKLFLLMLVIGAAVGAAKNNAIANVVMQDGSVKENVFIDLPKGWANKIKIKSGNTQETIQSEDVDHFVLWHSDNPDEKVIIKYLGVGEYNSKKDKKELRNSKGWMAEFSAGEHMSYMIWFNKIILKSNKIKFEINDNSHYFLKKGEDYAFRIPVNLVKPSNTRNWLKAFLADDPELTAMITEKGYYNKKRPYHQGTNYNPFFFEDIALDYNPRQTR